MNQSSISLPEQEKSRSNFTVFGDRGPPIVFLGDWFIESTTDWDPQIPYFSRFYRCFMFPLDGQEGVRSSPGVPVLESNLNRLISLINDFHEPVRIIAHGVSAVLAIRVAVAMPRRVRSMVLINPGLDYRSRSMFLWAGKIPFLFLPIYLMLNDPTGEKSSPWNRLTALGKVLSFRMAGRYMKELRRVDLSSDFKQIHCRISIIIGGENPFAGEEVSFELNEKLAHSHLFQYGNLGYNPHREAPEMINRTIHDFLKKSDRIIDRSLEQIRFFFRGLFGR